MTETWEPANHLEEQLRDALHAGDQDAYFAALRVAELFIPVPHAEPGAPQPAFTWPTATREGRTHVLAYTSPEAARTCLGPGYEQLVRMPLTEIARNWPNLEWWLAVDSGLQIEGYLPAWFIGKLTTEPAQQADAAPAHDGATAQHADPRQAASPARPHDAPPFRDVAPPAHGSVPQEGPAAPLGAPRHGDVPPGFPPHGEAGPFPQGEGPAAHREGTSFRPTAETSPFPAHESTSVPPGEPPAFPPQDDAAPYLGEAAPFPPSENTSIPPGELRTYPSQGEVPPPHGDAHPVPPGGVPPMPHQGGPPAAYGEGPAPYGEPPTPRRGKRRRAAHAEEPAFPGEAPSFPPQGEGSPSHGDAHPVPPGGTPTMPRQGEPPAPYGEPPAAYGGGPAPYGEPPAPRHGAAPRDGMPQEHRGPDPAAPLNGAVPSAPAESVPAVAETRPQPAVSEFDPVPPPPAPHDAVSPAGMPAPYDGTPIGEVALPDAAHPSGPPPMPGDGTAPRVPSAPDTGAGQDGPPAEDAAARGAPSSPDAGAPHGEPPAPETGTPYAAARGEEAAEQAVPPSGPLADPPITLHYSPGADFTPLDDEERALYEAAQRGDDGGFLRILAGARQIWVPMVEGADLMLGPGRPGFRWYAREEGGRTIVPLFTGPSRMREAMGGRPFVLSDPAKVVRYWPDPSWDLVVNAGSPIGGTIPGVRMTELSRYLDSEAAALLARDFPAQNDAERQLFDARGDVDRMVKVLLAASVFLPVWSRTPPTAQLPPSDPAFPWSAVPVRGRMAVAVFTSFEWMKEAVGTTGFVMPSFADLLAAWPEPDWSVSVNLGTPIEVTLSGEEIRALGGAVAEGTVATLPPPAGVIAPPPEPVPVEDVRPGLDDIPDTGAEGASSGAPAESGEAAQVTPETVTGTGEAAESAAQIWTIMQKVVPHEQVPWYRDKAYDRVAGFVHRVRDVIELGTPKQLYETLGLLRHGSPFHPDDAEVHVIRWPAYLPELYRVPFGGNGEDALATWGDDGWVVEAPPFQGDGFAPGSGGSIPEYKLDSLRLPHGAEMYVIGSDGTERFIARYDADRLAWGETQ